MNCLIKERDMKALAGYQDTLMRNPRLRYIFFELTDCCNLRCLHCGSSCDPRNQSFLPYSVVEKTLRSILREYDPHSVMVCLTGGEPVLHPDLNKIIRLSHKLGFPVGMTTIEKYAFFRCECLKEVTIPSSVTSIARHAFAFCRKLKTVRVSSGDAERVTKMLEDAGEDMSKLTIKEV